MQKGAVKAEVQPCVPIVFTKGHCMSLALWDCMFPYDSFAGCLTSVCSSGGLQVKCSHQLQARMQLEAKSGERRGKAFAQNDV